LADREQLDQGVHWLLAVSQRIEYLAPARLGEHLNGGASWHPVSMPL
jgi:acyl-CoA thioesterase FadM